MITNPNVKINLGLNVLRKREDGFHDLDTLKQFEPREMRPAKEFLKEIRDDDDD